MTAATKPSVFDAGLPVLDYDITATPPQDIYPQFRAAQQQAPIALGPVGPEVLSYELARTVLRDPPGSGIAGNSPVRPRHHVGSAVGPGDAQHPEHGRC